VLVVEGQELSRRGLVSVLEHEGLVVAGQAASAAVARALAPRLSFDVGVVDLDLPGDDGVTLIRELREVAPEACCVAMSGSSDRAKLVQALAAGASGFLSKDLPIERLGPTLRGVAKGQAPLSRDMTAMLVHEFQRVHWRQENAEQIRGRLTPREWQVLNMLGEDMRTREIADELVLSIETVRSHVKSLMRKLGVRTRTAAVSRLHQAV
jgi:DNA-binding NarL/FixJ family response regulator